MSNDTDNTVGRDFKLVLNSGGSSFLCPMWDKIVDFLEKSVVMDNIVFRSIQGALFTGTIMLRPTKAGEPLTVSKR